MKKLIFLFMVFFTFIIIAVPKQLQVQSYVTDDNGVPLSGNFPATFALYEEIDGVNAIVSKDVNVEVDNGYMSYKFDLSLLDTIPETLFLEVIVDSKTLPRNEIGSSVYALKADHANTAEVATMAETISEAAKTDVIASVPLQTAEETSFDNSGTDLAGTDVQAVIAELLNRVKTLEANLSAAEKKIETNENNIANNGIAIQNIGTAVSAIQAEQVIQDENISSNTVNISAIPDYSGPIANLTSRVTANELAISENLTSQKDDIVDVDNRIALINAHQTEQDGKIATLETSSSQYGPDISTLKTTTITHSETLADHESRITHNFNYNSDQGQHISDLFIKNQERINDIEDIETVNTTQTNNIALLSGRVDAVESENTSLSERIDAIDILIATLSNKVDALELLTGSMSLDGNDLFFTGINLHIRNGLGYTCGAASCAAATTNGTGNLILGYNEIDTIDTPNPVRTGSHNIVVGYYNQYSSYGSLIIGQENYSAAGFTLNHGSKNTASQGFSATISGQENIAKGFYSSIIGGYSSYIDNNANYSVIVGSDNGTITAHSSKSVLVGGDSETVNTANTTNIAGTTF